MDVQLLTVAVTAFIATNVDNLFLLLALYSETKLKSVHILLGQLAGLGALILVSVIAASATVRISSSWLSLLGGLPLALGIRGAMKCFGSNRIAQPANNLPIHSATRRSDILLVATLTAANGGDNLAVYIPLFANFRAATPEFAGTFALLTVLACLASRFAIRRRVILTSVGRYSTAVSSIILFVQGLRILSGR
jgi:cadmium resistance protein CadD (predicted permease)